MVKYKQLYHNIKDEIINEKKYFNIFQKNSREKSLGEVYYKKGGNVNGIKDGENGIP